MLASYYEDQKDTIPPPANGAERVHEFGHVSDLFNGTYYNVGTRREVIDIIETYKGRPTRLRFHYGDQTTGQDWGDVFDVSGSVGRTMGPMHCPLLLNNATSDGGGIILTGSVVRIRFANRKNGGDLYRHPTYTAPPREDHPADYDRHFA